jgi:xylose dehydrogenase (NAD/NADP)
VSDRLRWGLLSTARVNRHLIPAMRAAGRSEPVAVASRDRARGEAFAREWALPRVVEGYDALLADPGIDAVYVPLPNALHVEWTLAALAAGKHVLCEKPMALDARDVDRIGGAAGRAGRHVAECLMYPHEPQTAAVLDLLANGAIGALRTVAGCFTYPQVREADVRLDPALGGGSLWDVGVYPVSFACLLTGAAPVEARGLATMGPTGVDEAFSGVLRFPGDMLARVDSGFRAIARTWVEIVGADGVLMIPAPFKPGPREELVLRRADGHQVIVVAGSSQLFVRTVADFERVVFDGAAAVVTLEQTRRTVAACRMLLDAALD